MHTDTKFHTINATTELEAIVQHTGVADGWSRSNDGTVVHKWSNRSTGAVVHVLQPLAWSFRVRNAS